MKSIIVLCSCLFAATAFAQTVDQSGNDITILRVSLDRSQELLR